MPLIQVRVIKDVFSKDQKRQIIKKLTDAMVSIEGENMRGVTWVTVEEAESGDWGGGAMPLTTSDGRAWAAAKAPSRPKYSPPKGERGGPRPRLSRECIVCGGPVVTPPCAWPRSACG